MSLAQANFNSQSRVRFGQDFYDDRMKAIRKMCVWTEQQDSFSANLGNRDITEEQEGEIARFDVKTELPPPKASDPEESTEAEETIPSSTLPNTEETRKEKGNKETEKATQTRYRDPIHWFGILVPQALRSSQEAFTKVVEEDVSPILHLDAQLKQLEIEIRRTRKHIAKLSSKESRAQSGD